MPSVSGAAKHRRGVRLDQEFRRPGQGEAARMRARGRCLHPGACGLQPDPPTQATGSRRVKGRWRIVKMPDYEADFPDMMEPAYILFDGGGGQFAFGCVTAP